MTIEVVAGQKKGKFRILKDGIQEGCELQSHLIANAMATKLKDTRFPQANLHLAKT